METLTKEAREAIDAKSSISMQRVTHREKLRAQDIHTFSGWRNLDVLFFLSGFALGCITINLAYGAHYKMMCITCLISALCLPVGLIAPRGDLAKTLEYFAVEAVKNIAGKWIERKIEDAEHNKDTGVLLSIHKRINM